VGLGDLAELSEFARPGVCEKNVEAAFAFLDCCEESVEVGQLRYVALNADGVGADQFHGRVELGLTTAGDEDERTFPGEPLGGREADAAVAAGDESDLSF
jgi:hypothetical protein